MKKNLLLLIFPVLLAGCGRTSGQFEVECSFDQAFTGTIYLTHYEQGRCLSDSVLVSGRNAISFASPVGQTENYRIYTRPQTSTAYFIAEEGADYHFAWEVQEGKVSLLSHTSSEQAIQDELSELSRPYHEEAARLSTAYQEARQLDDQARLTEINDSSLVNFTALQEVTMQLIKRYPGTFSAVEMASQLYLERYPDYLELLPAVDTLRYGKSTAGERFLTKFKESGSMWMEGSEAPDFKTTDIHGRELELNEFRGQYVLLDFWASWCMPCRMKAKELKAIYPELKQKGIVVIGVSLDEDRDAWLKASREDGIAWNNTCECVGFENHPVASLYKVKQIPTLFLVGPDGRILRQNPDRAYLQKLAQR